MHSQPKTIMILSVLISMLFTTIQPAVSADTGVDNSVENLQQQLGEVNFEDQDTLSFEKGTWSQRDNSVILQGQDGQTYIDTPLIGRGTDGLVYALEANISEDKHSLNLVALKQADQQATEVYNRNLELNQKRLEYDPMPLVNAYEDFVKTALRNEPGVFLGDFALGAATGFAVSMLLGVGAVLFLTVLNVIIIAITAVVAPLLFIPYIILSAILLIPVVISIPFLIGSSAVGGMAVGMLYSLYRAKDSSDPEVKAAAQKVIDIAEHDYQYFIDSLPRLKS